MTEAQAIATAKACWERVSNTLVGDVGDVERRMTRHRAAWRRLTPDKWAETMCTTLNVVLELHRHKRPVQAGTWWPEVRTDFEEELGP